MKILVVTATYIPSLNGVAISIENQKRQLEARGHRLTIIAPGHPRQTPDPSVIRLPSITIPGFPDFPLPILLNSRLSQIFSDQFDIVYFHHPFYVGSHALYLSRRLKCPAVFFYHSRYDLLAQIFLPRFFPKSLVSAYINRSVFSLIEKTNQIVVETPTVKNHLLHQGVTTPIATIPNFREPMRLPAFDRIKTTAKYQLSPAIPVILCVSRLSKEKNLGTLLSIASQIPRRHRFQLVFAGGGGELDNLKKAALSLGIFKFCHFLGPIEFNQIPEIYSIADIFAYPCQTDTQAIVISEAMTAALPIIAFNAPGPIDFVVHKSAGFLCSTEEEFVKHLSQLLTDPQLRKKLGSQAEKAAKEFTPAKTAINLERLFLSLIK